MIVLAIDTSHSLGSVALARDREVLGWARLGEEKAHLLELGKVVANLLVAARLKPGDVQRIALVSGPGSFTGLRIGMAFVKGMHAALGIAIVTMNALELLSLPVLEQYAVAVPVIDARKGEVYAAAYARVGAGTIAITEAIEPPQVIPPEQFLAIFKSRAGRIATADRIAFTGSGALRYRDMIAAGIGERAAFSPQDENLPSAKFLSRIAGKLIPMEAGEIPGMEPFYLRSSDAKLKRLREVTPDG